MKLCDSIKGKLHLYPADSSVHAALHASSVYVAMWQFYVVKNRPCKKVALPVFYNTFKTLEPHSQTVSFNLATLFAVHNSATSWCSWFCDVTLQHVNVWCFCTVCYKTWVQFLLINNLTYAAFPCCIVFLIPPAPPQHPLWHQRATVDI